jgi:hypothetical protein
MLLVTGGAYVSLRIFIPFRQGSKSTGQRRWCIAQSRQQDQ